MRGTAFADRVFGARRRRPASPAAAATTGWPAAPAATSWSAAPGAIGCSGGDGADTFVFATAAPRRPRPHRRLRPGIDRIDLCGIDADPARPGHQTLDARDLGRGPGSSPPTSTAMAGPTSGCAFAGGVETAGGDFLL